MAFKLFPKIRRLPTLLGIFVLLVGIAVTTYLVKNMQQFFLKAEPAITPKSVQISNLTNVSFTVSWVTSDNASTGYIKYGKSYSLGKIGLDDRDQNPDVLGHYIVHHTTLQVLEPQTTYYFKIVSQGKEYDNSGAPYSVTTTSVISPNSLAPTYGLILEENGQPATEAIVYVRIGNSGFVSALTKSSGNWLIPLSLLVNQGQNEAFKPQPSDFEEIFVQGKQKTAKAVTSLKDNAPVPPITLGKDHNFRTTPSPSPTPPAVTTPTPTLAPSFNLVTPASGAALPGQPLFRGTALPGKSVQIQVESTVSFKGEVTADQNGNWAWQVPENLSSGEHTVTIVSTDNQGNLQTIIRKFVILASGTQVVEAATPSATPTLTPRPSPTATPTPTSIPVVTISPTAAPKPTATPTPTPTPSLKPTPSLTLTPTPTATATPPTTGDLLLTLVLAIGGMFFLATGFILAKQGKEAVRN